MRSKKQGQRDKRTKGRSLSVDLLVGVNDGVRL